jgi:F-type H+-transporting ATPase subunit delta
MSRRAAETYAQSLYEVAVDQGLVDAVGADLSRVCDVIHAEPHFLTYLGSPCFTASQKHGLIIRMFGTVLDGLTRQFLTVLLERGDAAMLAEIIPAYQRIWDRARGILPVQVTVAQPLTADRRTRLERDIQDALKHPVRMDIEVDAALLGGIRIRSEDRLIDNSLRGRLSRAVQDWNDKIRQTQF